MGYWWKERKHSENSKDNRIKIFLTNKVIQPNAQLHILLIHFTDFSKLFQLLDFMDEYIITLTNLEEI